MKTNYQESFCKDGIRAGVLSTVCAMALCVSSTQATVINLQIKGYNDGAGNGQAAQITTYSGLAQAPDAPANTTWNGLAFVVNAAHDGQFPELTSTYTNVVDSAGTATTVDVQIKSKSAWSQNLSTTPTATGAFWQSAIYNEFTYQPTVVLSDLAPNTMVNLYLFGDAKSSFSINGINFLATDSVVTSSFKYNDDSRFIKFTNVPTGTGGTITIIQTDNVTSGGNAPWNGLQIETVPEPTSLALAGLAGLLLLRRRRA